MNASMDQLRRYTGWVEENLETDKPVRGMIIASVISGDLILATKWIRDVQLVEYEISFALKTVHNSYRPLWAQKWQR